LEIHGVDGRSLTPPTGIDQVLAALHALDAVVRNATKRIVLSTSRLDFERSQREASSVILEAAAALGRPNATTGEPGAVIPDAIALRRDAFGPARHAARALRRAAPLGEAAWQDGVAEGVVGVPSRWLELVGPFVERAFDVFVEEYPLVGPAVRGAQRERLRRDVIDLLQYDWTAGAGRRFVAVERSFGRPDPVEVRVGGRSLFLRGQ